MSETVNMIHEINALAARPRGRACLVLTHNYHGQKEWAAELARQTENEHLDLLDHFACNPERASQVGQFSVSRLFSFLKDQSTAPVLIVSRLEFIKATWAGHSKSSDQFAGHVEWWDGKTALLFVLQYDNLIAGYDFSRFPQNNFVINQKETFAL